MLDIRYLIGYPANFFKLSNLFNPYNKLGLGGISGLYIMLGIQYLAGYPANFFQLSNPYNKIGLGQIHIWLDTGYPVIYNAERERER